jgi:hypothetical protein
LRRSGKDSSISQTETASEKTSKGEDHLALAQASLSDLVSDPRLSADVRTSLNADFQELAAMIDKLEHGHLHIAAFGRVSTGKSSLLNALLGEKRFTVSALHGETRMQSVAQWQQEESDGVFLIDTPGINEIEGEEREKLATEVAGQADLVLFVTDGDMTDSELQGLRDIAALDRPILLVLNKADRYGAEERDRLKKSLKLHATGLVAEKNIVFCSADPSPMLYLVTGEDGVEREKHRPQVADMSELKERLWEILESEGKTLAAVNAGLFAAQLSDRLGRKILQARRHLADRLITTYCVAKGVAVAVNPVPVADLLAAAFVDFGMVVHLSRLYGLPLSNSEAGKLVKVIMAQLAVLMGTVWAVHFVSSALKVGTAGLSTLVTAGAQGAVAYYSTYVVGRVAEEYLVQGCSWGSGGPKQVVRQILESLDRESIMAQGRDQVLARLKRVQPG